MGYKLYGTSGTAYYLGQNMVACNEVRKLSEARPNIMDLFESGLVDYVISTSSKGRIPSHDSVKMRRKAVELSIPCLTAIDTARVLVKCLRSGKNAGGCGPGGYFDHLKKKKDPRPSPPNKKNIRKSVKSMFSKAGNTVRSQKNLILTGTKGADFHISALFLSPRHRQPPYGVFSYPYLYPPEKCIN